VVPTGTLYPNVIPQTPLMSMPPQQQPYTYVVTGNVGTNYGYQAPTNYAPVHVPQNFQNSEDLYQNLKRRNYNANCTNWISQGWNLFKLHMGFHIGWALIIILINMVPSILMHIRGPTMIIGGVLMVIANIVSMFYFYGILMILKNIVRTNGNLPQVPSAFDGFGGYLLFCPTIFAELIYLFAVVVGLILLIIPGYYMLIAGSFTVLIFLEYHQLGISQWQSFKLSLILVNKNFCSIFGFLILSSLVNLLGALCLGVGILFTIPITIIAHVCAFRDVVGFSDTIPQNIV